MINDLDNDCRWQALIVVGEFLDCAPGEVWKVIEQYGTSADADMRAGVGCVLLEHLLEKFDRRYRARVNRLAARSVEFANTLAYCWYSSRTH